MPTFSFPSGVVHTTTTTTTAVANETEPVPESEPVPVPVPVPSKKPRDRKKSAPVAPVAPVAEEPEEGTPTFPNMVILKQTEHNYIVKHNHYPITTANSTDIPDLVSPNQIHKGQINKKRGRKPKAGFILNSGSGLYDTSEVPNIILHLKCHLSDLKTNESISNYGYTPAISEVESYTLTSNYLQSSDVYQTQNIDGGGGGGCGGGCGGGGHDDHDDDDDDDEITNDLENNKSAALANVILDTSQASHANPVPVKRIEATDSAIQVINQRNQKEIMKKINRLKYSFHNGEAIQTKINHKSACFWDTCDFDGPIYYIPIMIVNGVFQVSGCYCSPECAVAALLKEPLDTSCKFERLHLLHLLYGTSGSKGFKPAPNPNYLLDKYYGNLTIQEYRALLKGSQMIHIVNKPLTHILPELYEDNNDFLVNSKVIPTNTLKMKKKYKTMVVQGAE
jgi:hypothetical protein